MHSKILVTFRKHKWRLWLLAGLYLLFWTSYTTLRQSCLTMYVGDTNSLGQFIAYEYFDGPRTEILRATIRDSRTGAIVYGLSEFQLSRGHLARWNSKGNLVAIVDGPGRTQKQVIEIDLANELEVVRTKTLTSPMTRSAGCTPSGNFIHVEDHRGAPGGRRPFLKIVADDGSEIHRLEYGRGEHAHTYFSSDGSVICIHFDAVAFGDNVFTNGVSKGLLQLDAETGEQLRYYQGDYVALHNSTDYVGIMNKVSGTLDIVSLDEPLVPVAKNIATNMIPFMIDGTRILNVDYSGSPILRYDLTTETAAQTLNVSYDSIEMASPGRDGSLFVVTRDGVLHKLDLETGVSQTILNVRSWNAALMWLSLLGVPTFFVGWLMGGFCWSRNSPMLEFGIGLVFVITFLMALVRTTREYVHDDGIIVMLVMAFIGAILPLLLVWIFSMSSMWAKGIPIGVLAMTALVSLFLLGSRRETHAHFVIAIFLLATWQSLGILLLRRFCGHIVRRSTPRFKHSHRFTLRDMILTIGCCGAMFASLKAIGLGEDRVSWSLLGQLFMQSFFASLMMLIAIWSAFAIRNVFLSFVVSIVLASVSLAAVLAIVSMNGRSVGSVSPVLGALVASSILFGAMRYSRAHPHGYELRRS